MDNDPWATSTGDDPWGTKPDVLASSRLAELDGGVKVDLEDGGGGFGQPDEAQVMSFPPSGTDWGGTSDIRDEVPVASAGGWGSDELNLEAPTQTLPAWTSSTSDVDEDAWGTSVEPQSISYPAVTSKHEQEVLPATTPTTPDGPSIPLPASPSQHPLPSTPPIRQTSPPPSHFLRSPRTPSRFSHSQSEIAFSPTPASPSFSDDGGGFGDFSAGLPSTSAGGAGFGISGGAGGDAGGFGGADDEDDWGKMDLGINEDEPMPTWAGQGGSEVKADGEGFESDVLEGVDLRASEPTSINDRSSEWNGDITISPSLSHTHTNTSHTSPSDPSSTTKEDEWEVARQQAAKREARAPAELVARLEAAWKKLAEEVCGFPIGGDGVEVGEEGLGREWEGRRDALLYELSLRPPSLDTYPQPFHTTTTYTQYIQTLSRPLDPSTSLLARASQRAFRKQAQTPAGLSANDWDTDWLARSRLGETHDEPMKLNAGGTGMSLPTAVTGGKGKWSLWGRSSSGTVPLTTSGGGMLEIKDLTPSNTGNSGSVVGGGVLPPNSLTEKMAPSHTGTSANAPSAIGPTNTNPYTTASPNVSRVSSPKPAPAATPITRLESTPRTSESTDEPSAVGRFFGRFKRARAASPSMDVDVDTRDEPLSSNDLGLLGQVPAIPSSGTGVKREPVDLLAAFDTEPMENVVAPNTLRGVLHKDSEVAPRIPRRSSSRGASEEPEFDPAFFSSGLAPRPGVTKVPSDMDLLGGMDFGTSGIGSETPAFSETFDAFATPAPVGGSSGWGASTGGVNASDWDEPTNAASASNSTPLASFGWQTQVSHISADDDDGFGDFASNAESQSGPQGDDKAHASSSGFADYDDFGDFADGPGGQSGTTGFGGDAAFDFETPKPASQAVFSSGGGNETHGNTFASGSTASYPSRSAHGQDMMSDIPPSRSHIAGPHKSDPYDFSDFLSPSSVPAPSSRISAPLSKPPKPTISLTALSASQNLVSSASQQTARWPAPASPLFETFAPPPSSSGLGGVGKTDLLNGSNASGMGAGLGGLDDMVAAKATPLSFGGMDFMSESSFASAPVGGASSGKSATGGNTGLSQADLSFFDSL